MQRRSEVKFSVAMDQVICSWGWILLLLLIFIFYPKAMNMLNKGQTN